MHIKHIKAKRKRERERGKQERSDPRAAQTQPSGQESGKP